MLAHSANVIENQALFKMMVWTHQSHAEDRTCARHTCQKLVIQKCKIKQQPKCFTVIVLIYTDVQLH